MPLWIGKRRANNHVGSARRAVAARAVCLWKHARIDGDTLIYGDLAHNMLAHHVYGLTENVVRPTLIRLPGYPLFLAACFLVFGTGKYIAVLWVQVGVGLASCWMMGKLAERMFGSRVGMVALWLAALCPFLANYDATALAECLSIFCVVLSFFALERWRAALRRDEEGFRCVLLIGLAVSFAVLLRPDQGLLAAAVVPAMMGLGISEGSDDLGESLRPAMLVAMMVAIPLLVWGARNYRVFQVVQPLAPKYANDPGEFVSYGFYKWYRTWGVEYVSTTNTYWIYDGGPLRVEDLPARRSIHRSSGRRRYGRTRSITKCLPGRPQWMRCLRSWATSAPTGTGGE